MKIKEYETVKNLSYIEYCGYLLKKYGAAKFDYMTSSYHKNSKCSRTKEGLFAHHIYEDRAILLSEPRYAQKNPFEWQKAENLVYCDFLEHLFLHILICENPSKEKNTFEAVGIGGIINFIVPELNDLYSGWETKLEWKANCFKIVESDIDVYFELLKRFKKNCKNYPFYTDDCLYTSFNEQYGLWSKNKNSALFKKIEKL